MQSYDPSNNEIIWEGQEADNEKIEAAIQKAKTSLNDWAFTPFESRVEILKRYAQLLQNELIEFATVISKENGKPLWEAKAEVQAMIAKVDISIDAFYERCKEKNFSQGDAQGFTRFKPHGVVAVLAPFNFPAHLPNGHLVPALLAGNTVLFKPSELTPWVGQKISEYFARAGLPEGVLALLQGGASVGKKIVSHADIDGLFFTGSAGTGQFLQKTLPVSKILALEMGGNNPLVLSRIENKEAAIKVILQSSYLTAGQRCTSARRLICVESSDLKDFLSRLEESIKKIAVGTFRDNPEPFMGPVINNIAADKLLSAQESLIQAGGKPLLELKRIKQNLPFLTPGLIDVSAITNRKDEEIFGPLLQIIRVSHFEEALEEANATSYGLSAGLLSSSTEDYEKFWKNIKAGVINWNTPTTGASSKAPFGGIKNSGNHRPSAYLAADYCSYPVVSLEKKDL